MSHVAVDIRRQNSRLTVVVLMAIATMLFASFTGALLIRRTGTDWSPVPLPQVLGLTTALIALSSVTMEVAKRRRSRRWLLATVLLALAFLGGQARAWHELDAAGRAAPHVVHGVFFVTLCVVHAAHLLAGIAALAWTLRRPALLPVCATWWHFVGLVWIYLYVLVSVS